MGNTHMAVIKHLDNRLTLIAGGPEPFCREQMEKWERAHPLGLYDTPLILQIVK